MLNLQLLLLRVLLLTSQLLVLLLLLFLLLRRVVCILGLSMPPTLLEAKTKLDAAGDQRGTQEDSRRPADDDGNICCGQEMASTPTLALLHATLPTKMTQLVPLHL